MSGTTTRGAMPYPDLPDDADIGSVQLLAERIALVGSLYATGTAASRPAAAVANAGTWFIASDTGAVSVSNGTAWVQVSPVPADGIAASQISDGSVGAAELASDSVTTAKIVDANVTNAKLATDAVTTGKITDANVTLNKLAANSIDASKIVDGTVGASELASNAVTTAKIADANVTEAKLASDAVTAAKIADGTVGSSELASNAVTTAKITDGNVTLAKLAANSVDASKIIDGAVGSAELATAAKNLFPKLASAADKTIKYGSYATGPFNGGDVRADAVPHGLGRTPDIAFVWANYLSDGSNDHPVIASQYGLDWQYITVKSWVYGGAAAVGTTLYWVVIG